MSRSLVLRRAALLCFGCVVFAVLTVHLSATAAHAALVWSGTEANHVWDTMTPNFSGVTWPDGGNAVFGSGAWTTVEVDSLPAALTPVNVGSLSFTAAGYTIAGKTADDVLTLVGAATVDTAQSATIGVKLGGVAGLNKRGAGNLTLTGASTYTGITDIAAGTLTLSGNGALAPGATNTIVLRPNTTLAVDNTSTHVNDRLGGQSMTTYGGTLKYLPGADATPNSYAESIDTLTLARGTLHIETAQAAADNTSTLNIATVSRAAGGGTVLLTGVGLGAADNRNQIAAAAGVTAINNVVPWAVATEGGATPSYNLVNYVGGKLVPLTAIDYEPFAGVDPGLKWAATVNARPGAGGVKLTSGKSLNSLTLDADINLLGISGTADYTLSFAGGAATILQTGGSSVVENNGGNEYVLAFGASEAIFHVMGSLTLMRNNGTVLSGSAGLTKSGPGVLQLGSDTNYDFRHGLTGTLRYNEGTVEVFANNDAALTSFSGHEFNGGNLTVHLTATRAFADPVTVNADATITNDRRPGSTGAGLTMSFGTLAIGSQALTIAGGGNVTGAATPAGITFGVTTLSGNPTFNVTKPPAYETNNTDTVLTLGAIGDGGVARTITKNGNGSLAFSATATSLVNGTQWIINGGLVTSSAAGRFATSENTNLTAVTVNSGATLKGTNVNAFASSFNDTITVNPSIPILLAGGTLHTARSSTTDFRGSVMVTANSAILVDRTGTASTAVTHTLGTLRIGSQQLDVTSANFTAAPTLAFGAVTLTGNPTFNPNGTNAPTITLGALDDGGGARTITVRGNGILVLSAAATSYRGDYVVDGGRLRAAASNQLGAMSDSHTIELRNGGTFIAGGAMTLDLSKSITLGAGGGQIDASSALTLATPNQLSGSELFTKTGGNTLHLSAPNSAFTSPVAVSAGILSVNVLGAFTADTVTLTGGGLRAGISNSVDYGKAIDVAATSTTSRIFIGDNFKGIWEGNQAVKRFGTLTLNGSKVTLDGIGSSYNGASGIGGTLAFANTVLGVNTEIATSGSHAVYANLGTVTGGMNLNLTGTTKWTFLMDQPNRFVGAASVNVTGTTVEVTAANANLGNMTFNSGSILRLSAAQDTTADAVGPVAIAGTLDINANIGEHFPLTMAADSKLSSIATSLTPTAPVTFGSALMLAGTTQLTAGGVHLSGNISGASGKLWLNGAVVLYLSGNNSSSGDNGGLGTTTSTALQVDNGVAQLLTATARPVGTLTTGLTTDSAISFAYDGDTAVPAGIGGSGVFAVDANNTRNLDFSGSSLRLGSCVAGTVNGTITPNGTYRLGGGGGELTIKSNLNEPVGLEMGVTTAVTLTTGRVILKAANGYTGATDINAGTLQLAHADAAAGTSAINVNGTLSPFAVGELLLDPAPSYYAAGTLAKVRRNGGVIGWTEPKTLATLGDVPGSFPSSGNVVLGLGGEQSADITVNFAITDANDGASPVTLRKTGPAVLDLTGSSGDVTTVRYGGGTDIVAGTIKVTDGHELGAGTISFGYAKEGAIHFTADATLGNSLTVATGDWDGNGGFAVDAGKTATLTGNLLVGNRGCITKSGDGTLRLLFGTPSGADNRWGLDAFEGTIETNRMPDQGTNSVAGSGQLVFRGGRLHFTAGGPTTIADSDYLGFGALIVMAGTSSVVDVDAGADLKVHGGNGHWLHGELTKVGLGTFQMATLSGGALFAFGNGTLNLREGTIVAGGGRITNATFNSGQNKALSDYSGFTLKLQNGATMVFTQATDDKASVINGRLSINDEYAGADTPVATVAGYKFDPATGNKYGYNEAIGTISLQTGGTGTTNWSGTLKVAFGTANLNREAGAPVALSATAPAVLKIDAGATVNVGGTGDILTDSTLPTRHVSAVNDGQLNIAYNGGPLGLVKTAAAVDGTGDLSVLNGAALVTEHVRQDTLLIEAGASLKINSVGGASGTSVVNVLNIANTDGSFNWRVAGGGITPATTGGSGPVASGAAVPEPATGLLFVLGALAAAVTWRRRGSR